MKKSLVSALFILLALACFALVSCNSGDSDGTTAGDPVTDAPGTDAPAMGDPTTGDPTTNVPATDAPGTDTPDTDAPGTEDLGTEDPGSDAPEEPVKPEPIKIKIDGVAITEYKIVYPDSTAEMAAYEAALAEVKAAEAAVKDASDDEDAKKAAEAALNAANAKLKVAKAALDVKVFAKETAEYLAGKILAVGEDTVAVVCETEAVSEHEIVIGVTNRGEAPACPEYYSYKVVVNGKKIFINGYDNYAIDNAAYELFNVLKADDGVNTIEALALEYTLPDRAEYIEDIEKLYMRWIKEWEPDPRMLDYEAKKKAIVNVSDRLMTCAHRADSYYYPENSIESIISFYLMGGDVVELDIQATKDGVLILMHDSTLGRMTNVSDFAGKTIDGITFPKSTYVNQWTYEQLMYLNLKEGWGNNNKTMFGTEAKLTPFKIPTLVEALKVCKNRMFILADKSQDSNREWRYADIDGIQMNNKNYFLYNDMVAADNYESIIISYGYLNAEEAVKVQKWIYTNSKTQTGVGVAPLIIVRNTGKAADIVFEYNYLLKKAVKNTFGVHIGGAYSSDFSTKNKKLYDELAGKVLIHGWTILYNDNGGIDLKMDSVETWSKMYSLGYRMIMGNNYLELVKFAATTFSFDD